MRWIFFPALVLGLVCAEGAWAAVAPPEAGRSLVGETSSFDVTYLGATAGRIKLRIEEGAGDTVSFVAAARTDPVFSLFYGVDNEYRSVFNERTQATASFSTKVDEKRKNGSTASSFEKGHVKVREEWKRKDEKVEVKEALVKGSASQDPLSAFLFLRSQDLRAGGEWGFRLLVGKEIVDMTARVSGEENLSTKIGEIPSWVLTVAQKKHKASAAGESQVWIAKEGDHPLLKVKAQVKIGSVILYLREYRPAPGRAAPKAL